MFALFSLFLFEHFASPLYRIQAGNDFKQGHDPHLPRFGTATADAPANLLPVNALGPKPNQPSLIFVIEQENPLDGFFHAADGFRRWWPTAHWFLLTFGLFNNMAIPTMYCYAPEVYPTHLRSAGFGWASAASRAVVGMIPVLFSTWLWPTFGLTGTFSIILGGIVLSMIWLALVGPETRGSVLC